MTMKLTMITNDHLVRPHCEPKGQVAGRAAKHRKKWTVLPGASDKVCSQVA